MSQSTCTYLSLYQIDARLWVSILPERIVDPITVDEIPHSEIDKFYRPGFQWIPGYTYITRDGMIIGEWLSKPNELAFVERSVIAYKEQKTILINYLISRADAC